MADRNNKKKYIYVDEIRDMKAFAVADAKTRNAKIP